MPKKKSKKPVLSLDTLTGAMSPKKDIDDEVPPPPPPILPADEELALPSLEDNAIFAALPQDLKSNNKTSFEETVGSTMNKN